MLQNDSFAVLGNFHDDVVHQQRLAARALDLHAHELGRVDRIGLEAEADVLAGVENRLPPRLAQFGHEFRAKVFVMAKIFDVACVVADEPPAVFGMPANTLAFAPWQRGVPRLFAVFPLPATFLRRRAIACAIARAVACGKTRVCVRVSHVRWVRKCVFSGQLDENRLHEINPK